MSDWYFTKFGNDVPLPVASSEFTGAAMSGDGKTIAVGMLAYSQTSSNPTKGHLRSAPLLSDTIVKLSGQSWRSSSFTIFDITHLRS